VKYPVLARSIAICVAVLIVFYPRPALAQQVELSFEAGRVTLDARDVTIRELLDEWARRGNVVVVNAELVGDRRVSLQLDAVPERQALEAVLGGVAGYVIIERGPETAGPAVFGRLFVVAQSELSAVPQSAIDVDRGALTPPDDSLAERLPLEAIAPNHAAEAASDQAGESEVSVANPEPPDGRPDAAHPASAGGLGGLSAPADGTPDNSTAVEPPNGRAFDARPILARPIGPRSAPAPAVGPAKSTAGDLKGPVNDVKDANGREAAK
jgi:hypothetical protein